MCNESTVLSMFWSEDKRRLFWSLSSISKLKKRPRYLKDSPFLTVGTRVELMRTLGWNWRERVENFLIPKELHLSTRMSILDHWHHLEKQFSSSWFSRSLVVTTAASSANWNQWTGLNRRSCSSCGEKPSCLYFSCWMNCMKVLKHKLNKSGLRQSPWSTPRWKGRHGVVKLSEMMHEWKSV